MKNILHIALVHWLFALWIIYSHCAVRLFSATDTQPPVIVTVSPAPETLASGDFRSYQFDPKLSDIVINEFLAANENGLRDEDAEPQDWIELTNRGASAINLAGWSLTDEHDTPGKWVFPSVTVDPGQLLLIFASGKDRRVTGGANPLHTNFKLNASGEYLALFNAGSPRLAATEFTPEFPPQRTDIAYGQVVSGGWSYFTTPTPMAPNPAAQSFEGVAAVPKASIQSGLFTQAFALTLTTATPDATIYFTLDGREPTQADGQAYSMPLDITGKPSRAVVTLRAVAYRARYLPSSVATFTYIFPDHVLTQPIAPLGFPTNWVSSVTTRGDYEMDPQVLGNPRYASMARQALTNLPTVSIVMKVEDLLGSARGVYTRRNDTNQQPASAELIWPDGRKGFQVNCGLEIQGGSSTDNAGNDWKSKKLSMRLLFKGDFGAGKLEYPLFANSVARRFDTLILDAGLNMVWNHMTDADQRNRAQYVRDQFMSDLQMAVGGVAPHGQFVHLYLNGLYWGLYDMHERPDASFSAEHFGGEKEEYDVLKHTGTTLVDGNLSAWNAMISTARSGLTNNSRYEALEQFLDLPWFIDYMIINLWGGNTDWAVHNWYATRRRVSGAGFRFISWDAEHVLKSATDNRLTVNNPSSPTELLTLLRNNAEFRLRFADHVHRHFFNGATFYVDPQNPGWDPAHPERNVPASLYMKRIAEIDPAIVCESARWGDVATARANQPYTRDVEWLAELNNLLGLANTAGNTANYFPRRSSIVLDQFRAAGLYPKSVAPAFGQHGGRVARGFNLAVTAPEGTIYYTTNGDDPRQYGTGQMSPAALTYSSPVKLTASALVKARAFVRNEWSALNQATFQVGELGVPLRFTEIMYNPPGGDAYEFVELANVGRVPVDLSGMSLEGAGFVFPFGKVLLPGEVLVLSSAADPAAFAARYPGVRAAGVFGGSLSNGGERLALKDRFGKVVSSVEYNDAKGWAGAADGGGHSLELIEVAADGSDLANWRASAGLFGSPGIHLPVHLSAGLRFNELMADNTSAVSNDGTFPDWIELLNAATAELDASGYSLTDDNDQPRKFVFPGGTWIPANGFMVLWCDNQTNAPGLHTGFMLDRDGEHLFLYDRQTNRLDAVSFGPQVQNLSVGVMEATARQWGLALPTLGLVNKPAPLGAATNLVINEWFADATTNSADWLELHNRSVTMSVALSELYMATGNATFQIKSLSFVPPGGFVRLWADEKPGPDHLDFKLAAAGGWIELYDDNAQRIERIDYPGQAEDVSSGRLPDGSSNITRLAAPSPGRSNAVSPLTASVERAANGRIVLRFSVVVGRAYTVQSRDSLTTGAWLKFRDLPASSGVLTIELQDGEISSSSARFYRLMALE